jgi:hypothetical protein
MSALRNPKHERFIRAVFDGIEPAQAYVDAGYQRNRANHWKLLHNPRVAARLAELKELRKTAERAIRTPVTEVLFELQKHGIERVADFYQVSAGGPVVRNLRAVKLEIAAALLEALLDGFGIDWRPELLATDRAGKGPPPGPN